jgi:hypothetical protein
VETVKELASAAWNWILKMIEELFNKVLAPIINLIKEILNKIADIFRQFSSFMENENGKQDDITPWQAKFFSQIFKIMLFWATIFSLYIVTCGAAENAAAPTGIGIVIVIAIGFIACAVLTTIIYNYVIIGIPEHQNTIEEQKQLMNKFDIASLGGSAISLVLWVYILSSAKMLTMASLAISIIALIVSGISSLCPPGDAVFWADIIAMCIASAALGAWSYNPYDIGMKAYSRLYAIVSGFICVFTLITTIIDYFVDLALKRF